MIRFVIGPAASADPANCRSLQQNNGLVISSVHSGAACSAIGSPNLLSYHRQEEPSLQVTIVAAVSCGCG